MLPAFAAAMQTTAPTQSATGAYSVARPAERDEQQTGQDQRRDRHARDRIRRRSDQAGDARRDGREEEPEDDDQHGREDVALERHARRDRQEQGEQQRTDEHDAHRRSRARCAAPRAATPAAEVLQAVARPTRTIVGIVRASVIRPAASTAPAPMYRMYALQICPGAISEMQERPAVAGLTAKFGWIGGKRLRDVLRRGSTAAAAAPATTARRRRTSCRRSAGRSRSRRPGTRARCRRSASRSETGWSRGARVADFGPEDIEHPRQRLPERADAEPAEHERGQLPAALARDQHLGAGRAFRVGAGRRAPSRSARAAAAPSSARRGCRRRASAP